MVSSHAGVFNLDSFGPPSSLALSLNYHFKLTGLLHLYQFFLTHLTVKRTMQQKYQQALGNERQNKSSFSTVQESVKKM